MPFVITRLSNEPIILVQVDFNVINWEASMKSLQHEVDRIASEGTVPLYALVDLRRQDVHYSDILLMINNAQESSCGTLSDLRLRIALVGEHPLLSVAMRKFNQVLGTDIHHLTSMETAFTWAREEISRPNHRDTS